MMKLGLIFALILLTAVLGPTRAAATCETLLTPVTYATATTPRWVATGDFNEDGITDLAVAANNMVSILTGQGFFGNGNGVFNAPTNISVAGSLEYVMTGDFNDDGSTDLAVTNAAPSKIGILLGQGSGGVGNGTFGAPVLFAAGTNPQSTVAADFNEDGITDIAVANASSNNVSILMGQGSNGVGNAAFAAPVNYAVGTAPIRLVNGDFNEDGITDLAVSNNSTFSNSVSVLIGQGAGGFGSGTFAAAIHYPTAGSNPAGITSGDFNEDGITDLAVVNGGSATICIFRGNGSSGNGNGTFAVATLVVGPAGGRDIMAADYNGNGITDLAVTSVTTDAIHLIVGGGAGGIANGTFAAGVSDSVGQDPRAVAVGDFNEDGINDVATMKSGGAAVAILRGGCPLSYDDGILAFTNGEPVWPVGTEQSIGWSKGPSVMAVNVEVSRDGGVNWETIASNVTDLGFQWTVTAPATDQALICVSDAAVPNRRDETEPEFTICEPLAVGAPISAGADPRCFTSGDFNEDGIPDLAVGEFTTGSIRVLLGNGIRGVGNGTYHIDPLCPPVAPGPSDLLTADFNEDGILDLAIACRTGNVVEILLGNGLNGVGDGTFQTVALSLPVAAEPKDLVSGDFNEDGITDLAVACFGDDIIAILIGIGGGGAGNGSFMPPVNTYIEQENARPTGLATGDFDEDGILDIASIQDGTSNIRVLRGLGSNGVGNGAFMLNPGGVAIASPPSDVVTGDFNSDGITDLAVASPASSAVTILNGLGSAGVGNGSFAIETGPFAIETGPYAIDKGDFNLDGITDLVVAGTTGQAELLYGAGVEGLGNGTFASRRKCMIGAGAADIVVGDFLEDGVADLFVLCSGSATIAPLYGGCEDPDAVVIDVLSPNGGENFSVGSQHEVSWMKGPEIGAVDVELSRDGGANWESIVENTTETSLAWTVTPPLTAAALVRVSDHTVPNRAGASNAAFAISAQSGIPDAAGRVSVLSVPRPNPSAGAVRFTISLPVASHVTIDVYDVSGRMVRHLAEDTYAAGDHGIAWDGSASGGGPVPDGIYFLRAGWAGFTATRKILRMAGNR